jgi:hypothetical protein
MKARDKEAVRRNLSRREALSTAAKVATGVVVAAAPFAAALAGILNKLPPES